MKLTKLLVLGALCLAGLSASAADLITREQPVQPDYGPGAIDLAFVGQEAAEFKVGDCYVIYNVGAQKYFTEGNAWGTQASVVDPANATESTQPYPLLVRFTLPAGKTLEDNALLLNDYANSKSSWKLVFFDSNTAMFVDHASQPNYFWQVVPQGNKVYRLQASPANPSLNPTNNPGFVGLDITTNADNSALSPFLAEGEGHLIDWQFFPCPEWTEYFVGQDVYAASEDLKAAIEQAEAVNADVTAAIAVYNNTDATLEQIEAATEQAKAAIAAAKVKALQDAAAGATAAAPKDVTSIVFADPYYDQGKTTDDWKGDTPAVNDAVLNAEFYNKTFTYYQELSSAPSGVYQLELTGYHRQGSTANSYTAFVNGEEGNAKLFAKSGADSLTVSLKNLFEGRSAEALGVDGEITSNGFYVPNTMTSGAAYFENNPEAYHNSLFFAVENNAALTFGLLKVVNTDMDWTLWDDWKLTYYGNGTDALEVWKTAVADEMALDEKALVSLDVFNAYKEKVEAIRNAADKAALVAAIEAAKAAKVDVAKNTALWNEFAALIDEAKGFTGNPDYSGPAVTTLKEELWDLEDELTDLVLPEDELNEEIARLKELIEDVKANPLPGTDVTSAYLVNADFESGNTGWQGASSITAFSAGCAEAYEKQNFDLYQIASNVPAGVYEISLQGFYRHGGNDDPVLGWAEYQNQYKAYKAEHPEMTWANYQGEGYTPVAWVYLNDNRTPLNNVYDMRACSGSTEDIAAFYTRPIVGPAAWTGEESEEALGAEYQANSYTFPNGMSTSADAFDKVDADGNKLYYTKSAYGLVAKKGDPLRIGIKGSLGSWTWAIWDNFKLTYRGTQADVVLPVLQETLAGIESEGTLDEVMGKDVKARLEAAIAAGKEAAQNSPNDGDALFAALSELMTANSAAQASIENFQALVDGVAALNDALEEYVNADATVRNEATALLAEAANFDNLVDADVADLVERINASITKLKLPAYASATDENPIDMTDAITNPSYDANTNDGWSGANPGLNSTCAEVFNSTFDYYQTIYGLPAGTYEVAVQAFYRHGLFDKDYSTWTADAEANNHAFLYAAADADTVSTALLRLASMAIEGGVGGSTATTTEGTTVTAPNSMSEAEDAFLNEELYPTKWKNSVIVKLAEGQKLTIGLQKNVNEGSSWVIWDNWTLTYYGTASAKTPNDNPLLVETVKNTVTATELFNLNGMRIAAPQKGIVIMKQTMGDGSVVVKKLNVR